MLPARVTIQHPGARLPAYAGASILCCNAEAADLACLSMAPRHAIHTALSRPDTYLGGGVPQGRHPDQEDACIAYDIFLEVRACTWSSCSQRSAETMLFPGSQLSCQMACCCCSQAVNWHHHCIT